MRTFLGIPLPKDLRKRVFEVIKEVKMAGIRAVKTENLHWTVRFFGELDEKQLVKVKEIMDSMEGNDMEIEIRGIGAFPSSSYVKVLWIGVSNGNAEFTRFLNEVNKKFSGIGKDSDVKPHLTIGRVKFLKNKDELLKRVEKLKDVEIGRMKIRELILYESRLTGEGPVYTELKRIEW